ncbi:MAG TPA: hypothetical protein PKO06_21165, partial [Candidatus Ozemobacteraceae bacterium]|nr:hypothetical protein [Candidatus Ozemobacteraceae bacterium]
MHTRQDQPVLPPELRQGVSSVALVSLAMVLLFSSLTIIGGIWFVREMSGSIRQQKLLELQAIAELKNMQVADWRRQMISGAQLFASGWARRLVDQLQETHDAAALREPLIQRLTAFREVFGYQDFFLTTVTGNVLVTTSSHTHELPDISRQHVQQAVTSGGPFMSEPFVCPHCSLTHIEVTVPLLSSS